jgi:hypothetical protein
MHALIDTEITVHVSAETLLIFDTADLCHLHDGSNLAPHTVRRLTCDAGIVRIIGNANGQPLNVGHKTRSISPALKRALTARDKRLPLSRLLIGTTSTRPSH